MAPVLIACLATALHAAPLPTDHAVIVGLPVMWIGAADLNGDHRMDLAVALARKNERRKLPE